MRVIIYIILATLIGIIKTYAQEESSKKKTQNEISFSFDGDLSFSDNENSYFSTSDSEETFKVRAKFHDRKTEKVRAYLVEELGKKNMVISGSQRRWKIRNNGDTAYDVKIDEGSLRIFLDKELASSSLVTKFKTITKNIKNYTSGKSEAKHDEERVQREEARLEREAAQLLREADSKIREAEHLQREAAQLKRAAKRKTDK